MQDFTQPPLVVSFAPGTNVIIGPKGGGKSTLFDLLVGLKTNCLYKNVKQALNEFGFSFDKAIMWDGTIINAAQLKEIKTKEDKAKSYENRFDVIYQDDPIKKDLASFAEIKKRKRAYLDQQIHESPDVTNLVNDIKKVYYSMNKLHRFNEANDINWSNAFQMAQVGASDQFKFIYDLAYKPTTLELAVQNEQSEINQLMQQSRQFVNHLHQVRRNLSGSFSQVVNDQAFLAQLETHFATLEQENARLVQLLTQRQRLLIRINKLARHWALAYQKTIATINQTYSKASSLQAYQAQAVKHFGAIAVETLRLRRHFEALLAAPVVLTIPNQAQQVGELIYHIAPNLELSSDNLITLLQVVFHSPGASKEDITKWLKSLNEKGIKEFSETKLVNKLTDQLTDQVKVLVEGRRDYETLSLGQRSIYGLKYKFAQSLEQDLFLDQPEDNLDNNTVATEILSLLQKKQNQQVFIVTHNANIGILSNPQRLIIADLARHECPYQSIDIVREMNAHSVNYLEGGKTYLEQRFNKIIKGEYS